MGWQRKVYAVLSLSSKPLSSLVSVVILLLLLLLLVLPTVINDSEHEKEEELELNAFPRRVFHLAEKEWKYPSSLEQVLSKSGRVKVSWSCGGEKVDLDCGSRGRVIALLSADWATKNASSWARGDGSATWSPCASRRATEKEDGGDDDDDDDDDARSTTTTRVMNPPAFSSSSVWRDLLSTCSGVGRCSWQPRVGGDGSNADPPLFRLAFYCVPERERFERRGSSSRGCGGLIRVDGGSSGAARRGFVSTPGYPGTTSEANCTWTLLAPDNSSLLVAPLDISMREVNLETGLCDKDGSVDIRSTDLDLSLCGQSNAVRVIAVKGNRVTIGFHANRVVPAALLFYYQLVGCRKLVISGGHGRVVLSSAKNALVSCRKTYLVSRVVRPWAVFSCLPNNNWNQTRVQCQSVSQIAALMSARQQGDDEEKEEDDDDDYDENGNEDERSKSSSFTGQVGGKSQLSLDLVNDVVAPVMLMGVMLGAAVFVWFLLRQRLMQSEGQGAGTTSTAFQERKEDCPSSVSSALLSPTLSKVA